MAERGLDDYWGGFTKRVLIDEKSKNTNKNFLIFMNGVPRKNYTVVVAIVMCHFKKSIKIAIKSMNFVYI